MKNPQNKKLVKVKECLSDNLTKKDKNVEESLIVKFLNYQEDFQEKDV